MLQPKMHNFLLCQAREKERGGEREECGILLTLDCIGDGFFGLEPCVNAAKSHIAFKCKKAAIETEREGEGEREREEE